MREITEPASEPQSAPESPKKAVPFSVIGRGASAGATQIEELKASNEELQARVRDLSVTLSSITDFAYIFDRDGRFIYANQPLLDLWGLKLDEAVGKNFFDLAYPDDLASRLQHQIQQVIETGQGLRDETPYTNPSGVQGFYEYIFTPVFAADGTVEVVAGSTRDYTERKHTEILLDTQKQALEMVVGGRPLAEVLKYLAGIVEHHSAGSSVASILLLDERGRLHDGGSPSLPEDYLQAIDGLMADKNIGTCSAAAATGKTVTTPDIAADPKWQGFKHLPLALGLLAAWSLPIVAADNRVLGTFGTYFREKREPTKFERQTVEILAKTAALAIERKQAEDALRDAHQRITNIFESITDCFYALDADWRFTYVNPQAEAYFSLAKETMLGRSYMEVMPKTRDTEILAGQQRAMNEQRPVQFEAISPTTGKWIDFHIFPAEWGLSVYFRDITERKLAEEELNANEERLRTIFAASRDGIIVEDDERIVYVNQAYTHLFGYEAPEELIGKHVSSVISSEDTERLLEFGKSRVGGKLPPSVYEFKGKRKDGMLFELEASVSASTVTGHSYITSIVRDITERKRAEERLRESETRFRAMFEQANVGIMQASFDGILLKVNPGFCKIVGYSEEEASGMSLRDLTHPDDYEMEKALTRQLMTGEIPGYSIEKRYFRNDGRLVWGQMTATLVSQSPGEPFYMLAIVEDITERKQAEQALRESENKYRLLMEQASDGIHTYDMQGNFIETNSKLSEMLGYTPEELLRLNVKDLIPAEDLAVDPLRFDQLRAGKTLLKERRLYRKDGTLLQVEISGRMIRDGVLQAIIRDITERKQVEEDLRISQVELQKSHDGLERRVRERTADLSETNAILQEEVRARQRIEAERGELLRGIVFAQEDERRRIALEMHDQFGQQLTVLKLKLDTVKEGCGENEYLCEQVEALQRIATQLDADVDHMVWEMRPLALDDLGLEAALSSYVEKWSQHLGVPVQLHASGIDEHRLSPEIETALYRIAQEALNNIAKHAQASRVAIVLERRAGQVSLIVEDDGVGFDGKLHFVADDKGLGLIGMRERAALVGGTIAIESQPNDGATVVVRIPVPPVPEAGEQDE